MRFRLALTIAAATLAPSLLAAPRAAGAQPAFYNTLGFANAGPLFTHGCEYDTQFEASLVGELGGTCLTDEPAPGGVFTSHTRLDPQGRIRVRTSASHSFFPDVFDPLEPLPEGVYSFSHGFILDDLLILPRGIGAPALSTVTFQMFLHGVLSASGGNGALAFSWGSTNVTVVTAADEHYAGLALGWYPESFQCICDMRPEAPPDDAYGDITKTRNLVIPIRDADGRALGGYALEVRISTGTYTGAQIFAPDDPAAPTWFDTRADLSNTGGINLASVRLFDAAGADVTALYDVRFAGAVAAVPEPGTIALVGAGLAVLAAAGTRRRRRTPAA